MPDQPENPDVPLNPEIPENPLKPEIPLYPLWVYITWVAVKITPGIDGLTGDVPAGTD